MTATPFTSPSGRSFTKEQLTPACLETFGLVKATLPPALADRLRSNRLVVTHGSYRDLYLFDIWDAHQSDVLPKRHFTYCLNYCQHRRTGIPQDGELHLWLNTIRLYKNRDQILELLRRRLPKAVPTGFCYTELDRAITISHRFYFPADLARLPGYLVPLYTYLILAVHPVLIEVIDGLASPMEKAELRGAVRDRGRIPFSPPGVRDPARVREYTRSIPPSVRRQLLEEYRYSCAECGADLRETQAHIDHVVAFSRGGKTVKENLRPLCQACNLRKGAR